MGGEGRRGEEAGEGEEVEEEEVDASFVPNLFSWRLKVRHHLVLTPLPGHPWWYC